MVVKTDDLPAIADLTSPGSQQSNDPEYIAWLKRKVEASLAEAHANPEKCLTIDEARKKFRLAP